MDIKLKRIFYGFSGIACLTTMSITVAMLWTRFHLIVAMLPWMAYGYPLIILIMPFAAWAVYHSVFKQLSHLLVKAASFDSS